MVKRCSHGLCNSDDRYPERRVGGVRFVPFPKPKTQYEKCLRWIKLCGRPHHQLNPSNINRNTYVCTEVLNVIEHCEGSEREEMLCRLLNDQMTSDNVVQYLRLLTSAHLQNHADDFRNFVEAPSLQVYCHQEVEAMGMECDHVDILALTQALDICIHIVSMDGEDEQLVHHIIPDGAEPSMHLLHHISHFSILGPRPPP
ncbi:ubiquitin thioesterase OTUB2-like isoform X2 [Syngnathoides biaculeatus]|uniref:ubiquitin thioesterase OTUB2-like isoform X2 n=1 Tax=Syngnathoides biaculeatus TaxID=300417 RepID=UPI002ADE8ABE|nr:ubiquitin thioesterase OTUB2-like isoform X2 [Syngnathoides biaculeatus]